MHAAFEILDRTEIPEEHRATPDQVAEEILRSCNPNSAAAQITPEHLTTFGMTWMLETATHRYAADLPPNMSARKAVEAAAAIWEQAMCACHRPQLFRAVPTSSPERWLLVAADDDPEKVSFAVVQPVKVRSALYAR